MRRKRIEEQIASRLDELVRMSVQAKRPMLTYLLAMAMEELCAGLPDRRSADEQPDNCRDFH